MKINSIKYYFREGFTGLLKNRLMTVASIGTVSACILIMAFSYCIISNLSYALTQFEETFGISVFMEDNISADEISGINEKIKSIEHVQEVTYISPDEALDGLKEDWGADDILDGFDSENNPLSSSFELLLDDVKYQKDVVSALEEIEGVRKIKHSQQQTEFLMKFNRQLSIVGAVVILILGLISIVIIVNTIKISVYTRKTEINIMKFVGATDWFIRWPFVIEGVLIGFFGALIPILIAWPVYGSVVNKIYTSSPIIKNTVTLYYSVDVFSVLIPVALAFGILLGVLGSVTSIRKYLQV